MEELLFQMLLKFMQKRVATTGRMKVLHLTLLIISSSHNYPGKKSPQEEIIEPDFPHPGLVLPLSIQ